MKLERVIKRHGYLVMAAWTAMACVGCGNYPNADGAQRSSAVAGPDVSAGLIAADTASQTGAGADLPTPDIECCRTTSSSDTPAADDPADVIAALLGQDTDNDGRSDLDEILLGTDPYDPHDGPDIDGDGIENGADPDVDGDGLDNGEDPDIDGDGLLNGEDDDVDGDGLLADEDDDDDGDGIADEDDDDDDGDGEPDCECENGACGPDGEFCVCDPGWEGDSCDEFHCRDVHNCNYGKCIGPNECQCYQGWETRGANPCSAFHCRDVAECNGHGQCAGPNACECDDNWKGKPDCAQPTCVLSPSTCDDNDPCTVDECEPSSGCSHDPVICPLFETCIRGTCTTECTNASECNFGQGCSDSGCFDCSQDSDCIDGDSCTTDACDPDQGCIHEAVTCPDHETCVFGICRNECSGDLDCPLTESCRGGGCVTACADEQDCDPGEVCDDGGNCKPDDAESGG